MMKKTKILLNPRMLAATLMMMVLFASMSAQGQTTLTVAYDVTSINDELLRGLAVTGDIVIYGDVLTVSGALSHTMGQIGQIGFLDVSLDASRTYGGIGPGVRVNIGRKAQIFGHLLFGALRADVEGLSETSYGERYGGGLDFTLTDQFVGRVGMDYDGQTHLTVGGGLQTHLTDLTLSTGRIAQTTLTVAYDVTSINDELLHGLAVTGDTVVYGVLTVSGALSHTMGQIGYSDVSRTYGGIGPGVRVNIGRKAQIFGHLLFGALRAENELWGWSDTPYSERYGGGLDLALTDRFVGRVGIDYDGQTHLTIGGGFRF